MLQFRHTSCALYRCKIFGYRSLAFAQAFRQLIAKFLKIKKPKDQLVKYLSVEGIRPGHDLRYALDGTKLTNLGWTPPVAFEESLERTVKWTLKNPRWIS